MDSEKYKEVNKKNKKKSGKIGFDFTYDNDNQNIYLDEKNAKSDLGMLRHIEYYPKKDIVLFKDEDGKSIPFSVKELNAILKIIKKHEDVYRNPEDVKKRLNEAHDKITGLMESIDKTQEKLGLLKSKQSPKKDEETLSFTVPDEVLSDPDEDYMRVSDAPISAFLPFEEDYDLLEL